MASLKSIGGTRPLSMAISSARKACFDKFSARKFFSLPENFLHKNFWLKIFFATIFGFKNFRQMIFISGNFLGNISYEALRCHTGGKIKKNLKNIDKMFSKLYFNTKNFWDFFFFS